MSKKTKKNKEEEKEEEPKAAKPEQAGGPAAMGMGMAQKMMEQMGQPAFSPMAMMQKMMAQMGEGGGQAMPPMMKMCMGMCSEMLTAIKRTADLSALATPELHRLFTEWLETLEAEALEALGESGETDAAALARALNIGEESAAWLIAHLAKEGKVALRAAPAGKARAAAK